jgi:hypothetical protein
VSSVTVLQSIPRTTTWETLQKSRNLAAVASLAGGLISLNAELRNACLRSLMIRKEQEARRAVIRNWRNYDEQDEEFLRTVSGQLVETVKDLLSVGSLTEKELALEACAALDLSECMEAILDLVIDRKHPLCRAASDSLMSMCERWGQKARRGSDSQALRNRMLEAVYSRLATFEQHQNLTLVDAWLCLVHWDDSRQRSLISDPRQDVYRSLMNRLRDSKHPSVIQLLGGYIVRATTPPNVLNMLCEYTDASLAVGIAELFEKHSWPSLLKRVQQLPPMHCLQHIEDSLQSVNIEIEKRIWLLVAASSRDLGQVLRGAVKLAKLGTKEARQTAAEMLRLCRRPPLEELVPAIHAAHMAPAEPVSLGSLLNEIAMWLDSPSITLKKAAQEFLEDFTVQNLLDQVRHWPSQMCQAMAGVVVRVEPDATEKLTRELQSPAPKRRLAALQVTQLMGCTDQVSHALMPLLEDPRLEVRVRAIDVLGALGHEVLEQLIPQWLADASTDIQEAASRAVRRQNRSRKKTIQE